MKVSQRREREIARTRQDILEAAARAFVRKGYKSLTMQEIAREAGYTAASLYGYFESKEAILQGLRELVLGELASAFEDPIPREIPFKEKLRILLMRQLEVAKRRFEVVALLHMGGILPEGEDARTIHCRRVDLYSGFLREHATAEELGGHDPIDVSLILSGIGSAFFSAWILEPKEGWLETKLPVILDILSEGISPSRSD